MILWLVKACREEGSVGRRWRIHLTSFFATCNSTPTSSRAFPAKETLMSNLISSFIIEPVVRQARRFSSVYPSPEPATGGNRRLSHAQISPPHDAADRDEGTHDMTTTQDHDDQNSDVLLTISAFRRYSTFIRRSRPTSRPAVGAQENSQDVAATESTPLRLSDNPRAISLPIHTSAASRMPENPLHGTPQRFRSLDTLSSPSNVANVATTIETHDRAGPREAGSNVPAMSESLPADDGMRHLRSRIHEIRDMKVPNDEKARMMHFLMTERYNISQAQLLRPLSPSSFVSHDRPFTPSSTHSVLESEAQVSSPISVVSEFDPENPYNIGPGDVNPTFRIRSSRLGADINGEDEDFDTEEDGTSLGCQHYKRNVKVQCFQCRRWYTCRHCHDEVESHNLDRRKTQNMLCMVCGTPQPAGEHCKNCGQQSAWYYCDICKLWDDNSSKRIYHCDDCGICRRGEGLGKDYIHCKVCFVRANFCRNANIRAEMQCLYCNRLC